MFEENCPNCGTWLEWDIPDDVTCPKCNTKYETEFEYVTEDTLSGWLIKNDK